MSGVQFGHQTCRRSQFASQLWKTTALSTLALTLSGAAAQGNQDGLWQPQVRAVIGADNNGAKAAIEGFLPLRQTLDSVLFLDVRTKHDFDDGFGQDVGLGIRRIVNSDLMIGGYAYLNVQNRNSHQFVASTLGLEAVTANYDAHVNVHLPISGDVATDRFEFDPVTGRQSVGRTDSRHRSPRLCRLGHRGRGRRPGADRSSREPFAATEYRRLPFR